jgi:hypothetical protein
MCNCCNDVLFCFFKWITSDIKPEQKHTSTQTYFKKDIESIYNIALDNDFDIIDMDMLYESNVEIHYKHH